MSDEIIVLHQAVEHYRYCDLAGTEIEYRCKECRRFDLALYGRASVYAGDDTASGGTSHA